MNIEKFTELMNTLLSAIEERDTFIYSIPESLSNFLFDNEYSNSLENVNANILNICLGDALADDVFWFLYEWEPGFEIVTKEGVKYIMEDLNDFISYVSNNYDLKDL